MDKIFIRDLILPCIIGCFNEERRKKQNVIIQIEIHCNLQKVGKTDNLNDTIDYTTIEKEVSTFVKQSSFKMIEALAEAIAKKILTNKKVKKVKITIDKPNALTFSKSVAVEITRPISR